MCSVCVSGSADDWDYIFVPRDRSDNSEAELEHECDNVSSDDLNSKRKNVMQYFIEIS